MDYQEVIDFVCNKYDVTFEQLKDESRVRRFSDVRHIIFYILHKKKGMTQQSVANLFKRKTHGVVISGCSTVEGFMDTNDGYKNNIEQILIAVGLKKDE